MHPLHDYIARQISDRLKDHRIVVMGDPRKKLPAFFEEACEGPGETAVMRTGKFGSRKAAVCSFQGSFLEVRSATEPVTGGEDVDDLVVYVPGVTRDEKTSLPLEIEKAGHCYLVPALKQIARNVLRKRFTDVAIDEMLGSDKLTYADLARMTKDTGNDAASLLGPTLRRPAEVPLEDFRFIPERDEDRVEQIHVRLEGETFVCETRPIRRRDRDGRPFFERDWREYLTGAIFDRSA